MEQKQNETRQWSKSKTMQKALEEMVYEGNHLPHQDKFEASFDRMLNPPGELIQAIPLSLIQPFPDHPFRVEEGEELEQLKQSIRENGVMSPAIVRPLPGGGFQMISGHRRMAACKALELERMPAIAREMDDDIATAMMVEANLQREKILPSEKAFAYKMRAEALQRLNTPCEGNKAHRHGRRTVCHGTCIRHCANCAVAWCIFLPALPEQSFRDCSRK